MNIIKQIELIMLMIIVIINSNKETNNDDNNNNNNNNDYKYMSGPRKGTTGVSANGGDFSGTPVSLL